MKNFNFSFAFIIVCGVKSQVISQEVATKFNYPPSNWKVGCNNFWGTCFRPKEWHLGDDATANAGTEVFSIATGIVKHAQYHPLQVINGTIKQNYGGLIIIEHYIGDEQWVCSLYGHLGKDSDDILVKTGDHVVIGQKIGVVGKDSENGGFPPHHHLGIHKGKYRSFCYICNEEKICDPPNTEWSYAGYTICPNIKYEWHNPTAFIQTFNTIRPELSYGVDKLINNMWLGENLGFALTPFYSTSDIQTITQRQDFQKGVIFYYPSTKDIQTVIYPQNLAPGHLEPSIDPDGWDEVLSPAFIRAYNHQGRANILGAPYSDAGNPKEVHEWGSSGCFIQNFSGGSLGECALIFSPKCLNSPEQCGGVRQTGEPPEATLLSGLLWTWYRISGGPENPINASLKLGCPMSNVYVTPTSEVRQDFSNGYARIVTIQGGGGHGHRYAPDRHVKPHTV